MAYFDGPKSSKNWYARLEYSQSQSTSATTITLTLKVYDATGYSYNGDTNSAYYIIQGEKLIRHITLAHLVGTLLEVEL